MVAVYYISVFVNRKTTVSVSVERKAYVKMLLANQLHKYFDMRRACVVVDVLSVGACVDNVCRRAESLEYRGSYHP